MRVALCLMVWNEIDCVRHDLPLIDFKQFNQVFCLDRGSMDGIAEYLESEEH